MVCIMDCNRTKVNVLALTIALVAVASVAVVAMELAVLNQLQQDADARGCPSNSPGVNASQGRCVKTDIQSDNADNADESDNDVEVEEEEEEDDGNNGSSNDE